MPPWPGPIGTMNISCAPIACVLEAVDPLRQHELGRTFERERERAGAGVAPLGSASGRASISSHGDRLLRLNVHLKGLSDQWRESIEGERLQHDRQST